MMNLLIVGSGAREHTFAWKIHKSNHDVNIFMTKSKCWNRKIVTPLIIDITNFELLKAIDNHQFYFICFVGPEIPLINGIY